MIPVHPVGIGHGLARLDAHQNFMRARVVFAQVMGIVGGDQRDAGFDRQPVDLRSHDACPAPGRDPEFRERNSLCRTCRDTHRRAACLRRNGPPSRFR